jgi:paraquat-inducible protein B
MLALASCELCADVGPTVAKLDDALGALGRAADEVQRLAQNLYRSQTGRQESEGSGRLHPKRIRILLGSRDRFSSTVGERSTLYREVLSTLRAATSAARGLADLPDYFERHPEALIRGKR